MKQNESSMKNYHLDSNGCFVIEDYNRQQPFSNFFPGVADVWGIPMWVFFVNRGQGIASFGIEGKDKAILEFQPANKAYRLTSTQGFRTFIKAHQGKQVTLWEPFQDPGRTPFRVVQRMSMTAHDLTLEDTNHDLGLKVMVNYFTLAREDFPALVRRVTVENISRKRYTLELIDGLPAILAYGLKDWLVKNLSRTAEAWVKVGNLKKKAPYYHLNVEISDTPDVTYIKEGNFYFAFDAGDPKTLLDPIVDPAAVFGTATDFLTPQVFQEQAYYRVPEVQHTDNRTPSALHYARFALPPGKEKTIIALSGYAPDQAALNRIVKRVATKGFVADKARANEDVIRYVKDFAWTHSGAPEFDLYTGQTFLDNVLRGGLPVSLKTAEGVTVFNVFSRKHGDLERDYNYFLLSATPFSQGNGNYRDVNQNRRNDVWFNPALRETAVKNFLSLIQADGYNPLVVKGLAFEIDEPDKLAPLLAACVTDGREDLEEYLRQPFQPGALLNFIRHEGVRLAVSAPEFLGQVLDICHKSEQADHGEGFWSDHWTYNLDLIESFLAIYPDRFRTLLLEASEMTFYWNAHYVRPRAERYVLTAKGVRQYDAVGKLPAAETAEIKGAWLRTKNGRGDVYKTTLLVKLLCLVANKAATLDPSGIGIEMEADKPNWYDALNGLPGLLGSSISETLELKRLCAFLRRALDGDCCDGKIKMYRELATFVRALLGVFQSEPNAAARWHQANDVKEHYRQAVRLGIDGHEEDVSLVDIHELLQAVCRQVDQAQKLAVDDRGLLATYFYHEVVDYAQLEKTYKGLPYVLPVSFRRHTLPYFLEGFVHALRVGPDTTAARELYRRLRRSPLFDKKLKMYRVNADLRKETEEIGRTRIFPRGWLENESVWLHMEYKYFLEILRAGLHEEFFTTMQEALVPFLDPRQYGRSTLENSSFIVSSAHTDEQLHGRGFVARLSGSTAEFIHMWLLMSFGAYPFGLDAEGQLVLKLQPALPAWLFTSGSARVCFRDKEVNLPAHTYAACFLGHVLVVYHNRQQRDTFGKRSVRVQHLQLAFIDDDEIVDIAGGVIPSPYAGAVRDGRVSRIDVHLGFNSKGNSFVDPGKNNG